MQILRRLSTKKRKGIGVIAGILCVGVVFGTLLSNVFAQTAYYMSNATVELDGTNDGTATISLKSPEAVTIFSIEAWFDTGTSNGEFILSGLTPATGITPSSNTTVDGRIVWQDIGWQNPLELETNGILWNATYAVDKNTPAGEYVLCLTDTRINRELIGNPGDDYPTEYIGDVCGTVTVTRNDAPNVKPDQVVTFRDGEGHTIGSEGITKHYGDEDFTVTKEVTTGDGTISEYHPDDDGTGRIAHTVPGGDLVGVGEPGDVEICAWVDETENYAATRACYTVHVLKRPLDITGVTIEPKTYDGTTNVTVTSVSFEDRELSNSEYEVTSASFDDAEAGENKSLHISVALTGGAENNYVLNASNYNGTATISPYHLVRENVSLIGSGSYSYNPDGVEPEVRVEAPTHGGMSTLVEGTDYEVSYSNNVNVGTEAHVTVTGRGNYTTADVPVTIDFEIVKKGINNGNLIIPASVVEGHTVTVDDIRVNVDGHDLVQCENASDTNCDYIVELSGSNTGTVGDVVHVAITAKNNYDGVATGDIEVVEKAAQTVTIGDITGTVIERTYGDADFRYDATTDGDGTISYSSSNESVATIVEGGMVHIVGVGDAEIIATASETATYAEGSARYTVRVGKKTISLTEATVEDKTYDGTVTATVTGATLSEGGLTFGTDYNVDEAHFSGADAGNYSDVYVRIALSNSITDRYQFDASGATTATIDASATISPFGLRSNNSSAVLDATVFTYSGTAKEPTATVTVDLDGDSTKETTLVAGTDYTLSYENNVNAGTASATVNGQGNYSWTITGLEFTIEPAAVSDVVVTATPQDYTGSALEPAVTVTGTVNGESVTLTTDDYEVAAHTDFVNAGDYPFAVNGKDGSNYSIPTTSGTFRINKAASGEPAEFAGDLKIETGSTLADLGERTNGFNWENPSEVVTAGEGHYNATYTKNNDTANYETSNLSIAVYGLTRIEVTTVETDGGTVTGPGASALEGDELTFTFTPDDGYEVRFVTANGEDVTSEVSNGQLKLTAPADDLMVIAYFRRVYEVIKGDGQTHIIGVDGAAEFEIDADYELFEDGGKVYVDGELVAAENYDSWSASTMISLKADYMDTLAVGNHSLAVIFNDGGIARATFAVANKEESPAASDTGVFTELGGDAMVTGVSVVLLVTLIGTTIVAIKKSKRA